MCKSMIKTLIKARSVLENLFIKIMCVSHRSVSTLDVRYLSTLLVCASGSNLGSIRGVLLLA